MKYGDMKLQGLSIRCSVCDAGPFSATRGDYFMCPDDAEVTCLCGEPMELGKYVEEWVPA